METASAKGVKGSYLRSVFRKRMLSLLLVLSVVSGMTGCGSLSNQLSSEPVTREGLSVNAASVTKRQVQKREKNAVDYSTDRFNIDGINAFYILPGLENIPGAMACFEVLDYNSLGEFVYYYVTPCYTTPEKIEEYNDPAKNKGQVKDRKKVTVPEGRKNDYDYDAEVLMAYNPDTGKYRVMLTKTYKIDKENEFNPATDGRPYYYQVDNDNGDYDAFITERAIACKVAGREEYLIIDQGSLTGTVYDAQGGIKANMTYKNTLDNEAKVKKETLTTKDNGSLDNSGMDDPADEDRLNKWTDQNGKKDKNSKTDPDRMNALVTGAAMTEGYETYLSTTFFLGDNIYTSPRQISTTYMIYRQSLAGLGSGIPYISTNYNAEKQKEKWLSLDGKFFTGYDEYRNTVGYSMEDLKSGKSGAEYKDDFSPFISGSLQDDNSSVLVEIPDLRKIPVSWYDYDFVKDVFKTCKLDSNNEYRYTEVLPLSPIARRAGVGDYEREQILLMELVYIPIAAKRALQTVIADALPRGIREAGADKNAASTLAFMAEKGWLLKPGDYLKDDEIGFYTLEPLNEYGIGLLSDHTLSMISENGTYKSYIAPLDYFPENMDVSLTTKYSELAYKSRISMEPLVTEDKLSRVCYIYDTAEADRQKTKMADEAKLNDDARKAVDELTLLIRTSGDTWDKVKLGWVMRQATSDLEALIKTVSEDAAKAHDDGRLSDDDYKKEKELIDRFKNDVEARTSYEVFRKAKEDAKKKHDDGKLSDDEYDEIVKTLEKAEQDKLGLSDEDFRAFERLIAGSAIIADAEKSLVSGNAGKRDMLGRIEDLSKRIPEDIREGMLYLCAGFAIDIQETKAYPVSYRIVFPEGTTATVKNSGQAETVGGKAESFFDGVLIAAENQSQAYNGNTYAIGYKSAGKLDFFDKYTYGKPMDISPMTYYDGNEARNILTLRTDKGVRFFEKADKTGLEESFDTQKLVSLIGQKDADTLGKVLKDLNTGNWGGSLSTELDSGSLKEAGEPGVGIGAGAGAPPGIGIDAPSVKIPEDELKKIQEKQLKQGIRNIYAPLELSGRGEEAYDEAVKSGDVGSSVKKNDFTGFMSYRMLLTSSGYTRDTENRYDEAMDEGKGRIEKRAQTVSVNNRVSGNSSVSGGAADVDPIDKSLALDSSGLNADYNERYTGHLTSSKNISMISKDKALICSMEGGTKILNLTYGTVADDMEGSYYRAYQQGRSRNFKLLGFRDTANSYLDTDLPMAKVYTVEYDDFNVDDTVVNAFKQMLDQYAKDYLYREYRTELDDNDEIKLKEKTEAEKQESIEAGKIFDPENASYQQALLALENKYGIEKTPARIKEYVKTLRDRIAAVKPAITRIYELAGAEKLAGDMAKRSEGYWKNVEARMTMANEPEGLYDILVEIRMNDDVLPSLSKNQADKYRSYKGVLDLTKEHGRVSANEIYGDEEGNTKLDNISKNSVTLSQLDPVSGNNASISSNNPELTNDRLREKYSQDVINDIIEEYVERVSKSRVSGNETELSTMQKREIFRKYAASLLDRVNPDNFTKHEENIADEFVDNINHGKEVLTGNRLKEMQQRIKESLPHADAVWKLEELVISEKISNENAYSSYRQWLADYNERVKMAELSGAQVQVSVKADDKNAKTSVEKTPLSGKDRISYLRTSAAYKSVIGDLKNDPEVKAYLAGRKETWDDYCKYVIKRAGAGVVKDENGYVEGSVADEDVKGSGEKTGSVSGNR